MGQRLCLSIKRKGKTLANSYYHWSGYTFSSMNLLEQAYSYLSDHFNDPDKKLVAIRALEITGAGFEKWNDDGMTDYDTIKKISKYKDLDFSISSDRNAGYISCFPKSIQMTEDWAEEYADIDIDTLMINFDVLYYWVDKDEVKENFNELDVDSITEIEASPHDCDMGTLRDILHEIDENNIVKCSDGYYSEIG